MVASLKNRAWEVRFKVAPGLIVAICTCSQLHLEYMLLQQTPQILIVVALECFPKNCMNGTSCHTNPIIKEFSMDMFVEPRYHLEKTQLIKPVYEKRLTRVYVSLSYINVTPP